MNLQTLFGGPPLAVLFKLIIISVIVGIVLAALGLSPYDIIASVRNLFLRIYNMGYEAIDLALRYFLLGAVIVFPLWLISRVLKTLGRRQ